MLSDRAKWAGGVVSTGLMLAVSHVPAQDMRQETDTAKPLAIDEITTGMEKAPPEREPGAESPLQWELRWEQGLQYELKSRIIVPTSWRLDEEKEYRRLHGRLGAKIQVDAAAFDTQGGIEEIPNDIEPRRVRVYSLGNTYYLRPMDFKVEFGLSGGKFYFNEGYIRWNEVPWISTLQLGQFKAPMSVEMMQSSGSTLFPERASPVLAFAPGSQLGFQIGGPFRDERMTLVGGLYASVAGLDVGNATDYPYGPTARFTWAVVNREMDGETRLLHLGASVSYTESRDDAYRYRSRPESYLAPHLVDTGDITGTDANLYGLELAGVHGPLSVQAEYLESHVAGTSAPEPAFRGAYAQAGWLLTGDHQPYNANAGILSRVRPRRPFSWTRRQWGAWQAAARLSTLDLNDEDVRGGRMRNLGAGLNWYFTRESRLMFNYIVSEVDQQPQDGTVHLLQTRLQIEF